MVWKDGMMAIIIEIGREWKNRSRENDDQSSIRATALNQQFQMGLEIHNKLTYIYTHVLSTHCICLEIFNTFPFGKVCFYICLRLLQS